MDIICQIYKHSQSIANPSVWAPNQAAIGGTAAQKGVEVLILLRDSTRSAIQEKLRIHATTTRTGNNGNPTRTVMRKPLHRRDFLPTIPAKHQLCQNIRSSLSLLLQTPAKILIGRSSSRFLLLLHVSSWSQLGPHRDVFQISTTRTRTAFDAALTLGGL